MGESLKDAIDVCLDVSHVEVRVSISLKDVMHANVKCVCVCVFVIRFPVPVCLCMAVVVIHLCGCVGLYLVDLTQSWPISNRTETVFMK